MSGSSSAGIDPQRHDAVVFDLDGVLTDTASVHAAAWRLMFNAYLGSRTERQGEGHSPFTDDDYRAHVDGKPREEGVADFLASRGIELPHGDPDDDEDAETVWGLGNRKNRCFHERLEADGVEVFPTSVALVVRLRALGVGVAVFSSSRNAEKVLDAAGIAELFSARVDGVTADDLGLAGKPEPDVPLEAARRLGAEADRTVLVEDAISGVQAGRRGGFALVVGVERHDEGAGLHEHGADVVVSDLGELDVAAVQRPLSQVPDALERWSELDVVLRHVRPVILVDFDGTLAPIVDDPDSAAATAESLAALERLVARCDVAIVSGRDLQDLRGRVGVDGLWYAGSHGFELAAPDGEVHERDDAADALPALDGAEEELRRVTDDRAQVDWHKGRALRWLLDRIAPEHPTVPIYVGDDLTDEDALAEIAGDGFGVVVRNEEHGDRLTAAHLAVAGPESVAELLHRIASALDPVDAAGRTGQPSDSLPEEAQP